MFPVSRSTETKTTDEYEHLMSAMSKKAVALNCATSNLFFFIFGCDVIHNLQIYVSKEDMLPVSKRADFLSKTHTNVQTLFLYIFFRFS